MRAAAPRPCVRWFFLAHGGGGSLQGKNMPVNKISGYPPHMCRWAHSFLPPGHLSHTLYEPPPPRHLPHHMALLPPRWRLHPHQSRCHRRATHYLGPLGLPADRSALLRILRPPVCPPCHHHTVRSGRVPVHPPPLRALATRPVWSWKPSWHPFSPYITSFPSARASTTGVAGCSCPPSSGLPIRWECSSGPRTHPSAQ